MIKDNPFIKSKGDIEAVSLHEIHSALAEIIGPELYEVLGEAPDQNIQFKTSTSFDFFLVLTSEIFMDGLGSINIDGRNYNYSLFQSLEYVISAHPKEVQLCGLDNCYKELDEWMKQEVKFEFWSGTVNKQIKLSITNRDLLWFGSNTVKHNLFRLSRVFSKLQKLCKMGGTDLSVQEVVAVLEEFMNEVRSRLLYHSSYFVEMLGKLFEAINNLGHALFAKNPTNDARQMTMPEGLTSDVFEDIYGSFLSFRHYPLERIRKHTPCTTKYLKMRYREVS